MGVSPGLVAFKLAYQVSPLVLVNGIAANFPGGMLPIVALTQSLDFALGILSGANIGVDDYWANFQPLPGSTLISQRLGAYPYANQAVAANAVIVDPLVVSLLMLVPASAAGGYATKLAIMTALQATLAQHNISGGTYTVATPSFFYTNLVMRSMRDVTSADQKQPQVAWQLDFEKPLLTLADALAAQNSLMSKITSGVPITGQDSSTWGAQATVGQPPSLASGALAPATANTPAAVTSSPLPPISVGPQ